MSDLISRKAVLKGISLSCTGQSDVIKAEAALVRYVKKIPSAEPEIIRCKDCKHYRSVAGYIDGYCHMAEWYRRYQYPDDYCSRGERKDDE